MSKLFKYFIRRTQVNTKGEQIGEWDTYSKEVGLLDKCQKCGTNGMLFAVVNQKSGFSGLSCMFYDFNKNKGCTWVSKGSVFYEVKS